MTDSVGKIAAAVARADDAGATLRIAKVTEIETGGTRVRLDITGTAWVAVDADVAALAVGQRVYAMQQGPVTVVSGRLTGAPPPAVPVGAVTMYAGSSTATPPGYLLCLGQALLRTEWPDLYAVIGTTYGAPDSSRFTLPNLVARMPMGAGTAAGTPNRGETGGAATVALTTANLASHAHLFTGSAHNHSQDPHNHALVTAGANSGSVDGTTNSVADNVAGSTGSTTATNNSATAGGTVGGTGSGTAHENLPPFQVLYYMIRAA